MSISLIKYTKSISLSSLIFILAIILSSHDGVTEEREWKLMGGTDNGKSLLYIDAKSIAYESENVFTIKAKKELSSEGMEERRKAFDESVRRAEKESGGKVEDPDDLFKVIIKSEVKEYLYEIDCKKNELRNIPLKMSSINVVRAFPILPNSVEEKIKREFCRGN